MVITWFFDMDPRPLRFSEWPQWNKREFSKKTEVFNARVTHFCYDFIV